MIPEPSRNGALLIWIGTAGFIVFKIVKKATKTAHARPHTAGPQFNVFPAGLLLLVVALAICAYFRTDLWVIEGSDED